MKLIQCKSQVEILNSKKIIAENIAHVNSNVIITWWYKLNCWKILSSEIFGKWIIVGNETGITVIEPVLSLIIKYKPEFGGRQLHVRASGFSVHKHRCRVRWPLATSTEPSVNFILVILMKLNFLILFLIDSTRQWKFQNFISEINNWRKMASLRIGV